MATMTHDTHDEQLQAAREALRNAEMQIDAHLNTALQAVEEARQAETRIADLERQVRELTAALAAKSN